MDVLMDLDAQKLYISTLLGNPSLFARTNHIIQASYFDTTLRPLISFLKEYYQEYKAIPSSEIFFTKTKTKIDYVKLPPQDMQYIAEQIAMYCQTRAVTEAVLRAPAYMEKGDFGKMVDDIKRATQIQLHTDLGIDYFNDSDVRIKEMENDEVTYPTLWRDVDALITGIARQELIMFTGNSGAGKSVAKLNLARNLLKQGLSGVYISLEMRDKVVAKRLDSMLSKITGKNISSNSLKVNQEIESFKNEHGSRFFIKRMRENTTTANDIASYIHELIAVHGFKPDFIVVDYIDIMGSIQKGHEGNMFLKDKFVTEEIRALGFDFNCIMISSSQLGRGAIEATRKNQSLGQDHIQGGMSKINTADLVIAVVKDEAMDAAGEYRFEFLKSRNSNAVNKKIMLRWLSESLEIVDWVPVTKVIKSVNSPRLDSVIPGQKKDTTSLIESLSL